VSLRLLSYNIRLGGSGRENAIASVIKFCEPDLVILEEATRPDVVQKLSMNCGMPTWGAVHGDSLAFLSRDIEEGLKQKREKKSKIFHNSKLSNY